MEHIDKVRAGEKLALVINLAFDVSEAEADALVEIAQQQEAIMPFLNPTRWIREQEGLMMTRQVAESFLAFRRLLAQTPMGRAHAAAESGAADAG